LEHRRQPGGRDRGPRDLSGTLPNRFAPVRLDRPRGDAGVIALGLLAGLTDETTLSVARALVARITVTQNTRKEFVRLYESWLAYREHRPAEALALLDKYLSEPQVGMIRSWADSSPATRAQNSFFRALLCAELGRAEEARLDYAKGRADLKLALGDKPGHDRGTSWQETYRAESWQREAEAVFKAKGISLPEDDAK
jgi:hypothetical protein